MIRYPDVTLLQNCVKGQDKILGRIGLGSFKNFLLTSQGEEDVRDEDLIAAMESCTTRHGKHGLALTIGE